MKYEVLIVSNKVDNSKVREIIGKSMENGVSIINSIYKDNKQNIMYHVRSNSNFIDKLRTIIFDDYGYMISYGSLGLWILQRTSLGDTIENYGSMDSEFGIDFVEMNGSKEFTWSNLKEANEQEK